MSAPTKNQRVRHLIIFGVVAFVLLLAAILIPHSIVGRVARNEAAAMGNLRLLTALELRYAAAHPSEGFTCKFDRLKMEKAPIAEGYRFSIDGCETDSNGVVVRYKATAVPVVQGKTGLSAFCIDQTRKLQYGVNGSAESCRPYY
jgi:hypothetical protein